jgi:hypothetical protein
MISKRLKITSHLDYLTVSFDWVDKPEDLIPPVYHAFRVETDAPPLPNYSKGFKLNCGGYINLSDAKNETQGSRLDLPGKALAYLRQHGMSDESYLPIFLGKTGLIKRTTRCDYCFNIRGGGSARQVLSHFARGFVDSKFKNEPVVKHGTPDKRGGISPYGATVEFGAETSEQRIAIYDKAADLKLLDEAWLRVELRTRKPVSTVFTSDAAKFGFADAARSRIGKLLNYPKLYWWQKMMDGDTCEVEEVPDKPDNFWWWMDNQVFIAGKNRKKKHPRDIDRLLAWAGSYVEMLMED